MEVILLQRIERLGQMGETVRVKNGYARNYLLPGKKALRATKENKARFEQERAQLEARNLEQRKEAESVGGKLGGQSFVLIRQAGESGQLYGSVSSRDIATAITEGGTSVDRGQVALSVPIKALGLHEVRIQLHPEVSVTITVNVARSAEEATRQARGEDVTAAPEEVEELDAPDVQQMFEEGASPREDDGEEQPGTEAEADAEDKT